MSVNRASKSLNLWREMTILAVMVMEASWAVLWLQILSTPLRQVSAQRILLVCLLTLLISHLLTRFLNLVKLRKTIHRAVLAGFLFICFFINLKILMANSSNTQFTDFLSQPLEEVTAAGRLIPPEIWIIVATLLLIWRGAVLARSWAGRETVFTSFFWGIGFFAIYGVFSLATQYMGPLWLLYIFISAVLIAMVSARVSTLVIMRGGTHSPFDMRWVVSIFLASALITGIAGFVSGIFSRQVAQLNALFRLIVYGIITVLVLPFAYLLKMSEPAIQAVQSIITTPTPTPQIPAMEEGLDADLGPVVLEEMVETNNNIGIFVQGALVLVVVLIVVLLIFKLSSSWQANHSSGESDERQSLLDGKDLWKAFLDALRNRLFKPGDDNSPRTRLRGKSRLRAAARIRRIYADFMELCNELGRPRPQPVTPLEFLPSAVSVFPGLDEELVEITHSYLRVRYGELPEMLEEVERVESAWKRVNDQGALLKKQFRVQKQSPPDDG